MSDTPTHTYFLLLSPEQEALLATLRDIATQLLGSDASGWGDPVADGAQWVSSQGPAQLRMAEPGEDGSPGWIELSGFEGGGRARWILGEPPRLELEGLPDSALDAIWNTMRAQQAHALREWVRTRGPQPVRTGRPVAGFKSLFRAFQRSAARGPLPCELPRVSSPPFVPDGFPRWLYSGELSSLPRHVETFDALVAGVAFEAQPEQRLLVRPVHRAGAQSIVPIVMMRAGHRPHGGKVAGRTFVNPSEVARALIEPLGRLAGGVKLEVPRFSADRDTDASPVFIARWHQLEQSDLYPFRMAGAVHKVPRSDVSLRMLEVRSAFAAPGEPDALMELSVDGLPGGAQVHVTGKRSPGAGMAWQVRSFVIGPRESVEDLRIVVENALG